jgi:hypothetical protein
MGVETRILVAFEDEYRAYRSVIAAGIRALRPHAEVEVSGLETLAEDFAHFLPQVVVSSRSCEGEPDGWLAWVEVPVDPVQPMKACMGERRWEYAGSAVELLMEVVEEAEKQAASPDPEGSGTSTIPPEA